MGCNYRLEIPVDMEVLNLVIIMSDTPTRSDSLTIPCCLEEIVVVVSNCIWIPSSTFTQNAGPTIGIGIHARDIYGTTSIIVGTPPFYIWVWVVVCQRHVDSILASLSFQFLLFDKCPNTQNALVSGKVEPNLHVIDSGQVWRTGLTIPDPLAAEFIFYLH